MRLLFALVLLVLALLLVAFLLLVRPAWASMELQALGSVTHGDVLGESGGLGSTGLVCE
jgi:hypothetical protein